MELLDTPRTIEAPAAPARAQVPALPVAAPALTIKDAAVAHLRAQEPAIRALAERYRAVALDLSTPKGLKAGKDARLDLRENGRLAVQRGRDATKDLLNAAKADVIAEADRLIALIRPVEDHVHAQIEAREAVLAAEKAERERIEAERIAKHEAGIAKIRGYLAMARGLPSASIARGVAVVEALAFGPEWEEFAVPAADAQCETLEALRGLLATTIATEEAAAELARVKAEQARIAEEQRMQAKRLAEEAEAARKVQQEKADALAAQQAEFDAKVAAFEAQRKCAEPRPEPATAPPAAQAKAVESTAPVAPVAAPVAAPAPSVAFESFTAPSGSTLGTIHKHQLATLEECTAAELRNEWKMFETTVDLVMPTLAKHAANVDRLRFVRALDRMRTLFA